MEEPAIHKALTTLEFLSQDKRARQLYEDRQKALMTYSREEGEPIGRMAERRLVAQALLGAGDSVEKVMQVTGLSRDEIDALNPH